MPTNPDPIVTAVKLAHMNSPHPHGGKSKRKARSFVRGSARAWMIDARIKKQIRKGTRLVK